MEILYSAIEEKHAELEESLTTVHQRQEQIRQDFSCNEDPESFTQNDSACIQLEELSEQERTIHEELAILTQISQTNGEFENIRLAARDAHTCILNENDFGTSIGAEEEKLNRFADKSDHKYQDLLIEYKRLKKAPPNHISQEELLSMFMDIERKIAKAKTKRDLFVIMAERMLHELNLTQNKEDITRDYDGLTL